MASSSMVKGIWSGSHGNCPRGLGRPSDHEHQFLAHAEYGHTMVATTWGYELGEDRLPSDFLLKLTMKPDVAQPAPAHPYNLDQLVSDHAMAETDLDSMMSAMRWRIRGRYPREVRFDTLHPQIIPPALLQGRPLFSDTERVHSRPRTQCRRR